MYCSTADPCQFSCDKGDCTMITAGSGESKLTCDKGGCTIANLGSGSLSEIKCQKGGCTIYCLGEGGCVLHDCEKGGCTIEGCSSKVRPCGDKNAMACEADCP
jgi:hypothetical protein